MPGAATAQTISETMLKEASCKNTGIGYIRVLQHHQLEIHTDMFKGEMMPGICLRIFQKKKLWGWSKTK